MPSVTEGTEQLRLSDDIVNRDPHPNGLDTNDSAQSHSIPSHYLGVKPLGNQYFSDGPNARSHIGDWAGLPDEVIMTVMEYLDKAVLLALGSTCKFLYAACHSEEVWKALFLQYVAVLFFNPCLSPCLA